MGITTLQREARAKGLGSSDAAAVLGYSPWQSPEDVRLIKLGLVEPQEDAGELAEIGNALEGGIADLAAKRLNCRLVKPTATYIHPSGFIRVNVDRQVEKAAKGARIVEVKDSGLDDGWGNDELYGVPAYVLIQVCVQMLVVDTDMAHVARLGRGWKRGLSMFEIPRDETVERIIRGVEGKLLAWWDSHIVQGKPADPKWAPASWDILKRVRRTPKTTVQIDTALVTDWQAKAAAAKQAETAADEAKRRVIGAIGDAEAGECADGVVTYLEQTRKQHIVAESTFRVAKFKPIK